MEVPSHFSEENCPPDQTITIKTRNEIKDNLDSLLKKKNQSYTFSTLNSEVLYLITSFHPFQYTKLTCEDRPVFSSTWVQYPEHKKEKKEIKPTISSSLAKKLRLIKWILFWFLVCLIMYLIVS
jgi:hypothetical protein